MALALLPAPVDYVDLDFASLRKRLIGLIQSVFPDLDLDSAAELAVMLVEGKAYVGDVLAYYLRKMGREARITTATQRKSIYGLVKLIGYKPRGATAATVLETFTLAAPAAADVTLAAGQKVRTPDVATPIRFQLLEDLVIPAGQTTAAALVEHSEFQDDAYDSSGTAFQRFTLSKTPYLDGSAVVTAANGAYTEVDNFLSSKATDLHYTVVVDQLDRCTIVFGNGINGAIPQGTIQVAYKTGGGTDGNVQAAALSKIDGNFTDANGNPVRISATNTEKPSPGTDRQTVAQIAQLAPASLTVQGRAVANPDFEVTAQNVPGVARALMLTASEDPSVGENQGMLFIVPVGGGYAGQTLKTLVLSQFQQVSGYPKPVAPKLNAFPLIVQDPMYATFNVYARVFFRQGYKPAAVRAAIAANLAAFFAPLIDPATGAPADDGVPNPLINFGYYLQDIDGNPTGSFALSDINDVVRDTPGVLKLGDGANDFTVNGLREDPPVGLKEFPQLGTVTIIDGKTGLEV